MILQIEIIPNHEYLQSKSNDFLNNLQNHFKIQVFIPYNNIAWVIVHFSCQTRMLYERVDYITYILWVEYDKIT